MNTQASLKDRLQAENSFLNFQDKSFQSILPNLEQENCECQIGKLQLGNTLNTLSEGGLEAKEKLNQELRLVKKKNRNKVANENLKKGHWSKQENKKYHLFLEIYNQHFIQKEMRRLDKIFKTMAQFIHSRQAEQCRSHHQKMQKKYHSFPKILLYLRSAHYGNESILPILEQINKFQIKEKGIILEAKELLAIQQKQSAPDTPRTLDGGNIFKGMQIEKEIQGFWENRDDQFQNILGNDYQMQLNFIDELLF